VIVVGGCSRIPAIKKMLKDYFSGKELNFKIHADQGTVEGAAMHAAAKFRTRTADQGCTHKLKTMAIEEVSGLWLTHKIEGQTKTTPVFTKNRRTPQNQFVEVKTTKDDQPTMRIEVFQGMNVKEQHLIRDFTLKGIPKGEAGLVINMRYDLDRDGILSVKALDEDGKDIPCIENKYSKKGLLTQAT